MFAGAVALFVAVSVGYVVTDKMTSKMESGADKGTIIASVGGEPVYLSDVSSFWQSNNQLKSAPIELVYRDILNAVLEGKALSYQAKKQGINRSAAYKAELKKIEEQALIALYIKQKLDEAITEDALKAEYAKFVEQNPTEDEVQASHILVDTEDLAKNIIAEIKGGADFAELAAKYSIDSNGKNGGKLNYFKKGDMVPEFASAVFSMNVGDVSDKPIKTMFGWHVVKVTDRRKSASPDFEQVKDYLKMKLSEELYPNIIKEAKDSARIIFMPAAYKNTLIDIYDDDKLVADVSSDNEEVIIDDNTDADSDTVAEDEEIAAEEVVQDTDSETEEEDAEVEVEVVEEGADNNAVLQPAKTESENGEKKDS